MTSKKESVEGREHRRFKVPKDAFVALRSDYLKLGQIEHVGIDGLEFSYASSEGPLDAPFELDIFLAGTAFYLYKVPFQMPRQLMKRLSLLYQSDNVLCSLGS